MALPVTISVTCGGTPLVQGDDYLSLTLTQDLFEAHVLTLTASFDLVESTRTLFFAQAPARLLGQPITLEVRPQPSFEKIYAKPLRFKGFITGLSTSQDTDLSSTVQVTAHSADYQLTSGLQRRTFRQQSLRAIFTQVLQPYPVGELPYRLAPRTIAPLPYVVQYQETNFAFLSRLAAAQGEWLYSDGQTLHLGPPPTSPELVFEADGVYNRFTFALALRPTSTTLYGYDYQQHQHTTASPTTQAVAGLQRHRYGELVLRQSAQFFRQPRPRPRRHPPLRRSCKRRPTSGRVSWLPT